MSEPTSPVIQRRQLAASLRDARIQARMTIEQVAEHLMCSTAKISRLETGQRPASPRDVRDLCVYYRLDQQTQDRLLALARQSRRPGWWEEHRLTPTYSTYVGLESVASYIEDFKGIIVPGLLQTPEYARAVIEGYFSPGDPTVVERLTRTRMERQAMLFGRPEPPSVHVVLDEAALHRVVGTPKIMAEQLERLVVDVDALDIQIQVIPFSAGAHAGVETTFSILTFADPAVPTAVFTEDVFGIMQLNSADDLEKCQRIFGQVVAAALPPDESVELIGTVRRTKYGDA